MEPLGWGAVLAGEAAVVGQKGLGWAALLSVVAWLWGWLCAQGLLGQELCSEAGPWVVASWVGLELGACLERKLVWAAVPSARVSPQSRRGCSASHGSGRRPKGG